MNYELLLSRIKDEYSLRLMEHDDLEQVLEWRNSERVRASMYTDQVIALDSHKAWFKRTQMDPSTVHLIFECKNKPAGVVNFTQMDQMHGRAYWGFYLGDANLPRGSGTIMGLLACNYAFENLKIRKLCGEAFAFNQLSIQFHKKLGFIVEGQLRNHVRKNDNYEDIILFAQLDEQWSKNKVKVCQLVSQYLYLKEEG